MSAVHDDTIFDQGENTNGEEVLSRVINMMIAEKTDQETKERNDFYNSIEELRTCHKILNGEVLKEEDPISMNIALTVLISNTLDMIDRLSKDLTNERRESNLRFELLLMLKDRVEHLEDRQ